MRSVAPELPASESQGALPRRRPRALWTAVTALEVAAAVTAVLLDLWVPTLVLLALAVGSLLLRRQGFASLGFHRVAHPGRLAVEMFALAGVWSVVQLGVVMPLVEHVSGKEQDFSDFEDVRGNLGMLIGLLVLSWTVAAVGEETAYRGYLQTRLAQLFGAGRGALMAAILISSVLFGRVHSEQGLVGIVAIALDGVVFSIVRYRWKSVWASVLVHGFNNTIGFVVFFFVGPLHGLW